MFRKVSSFVGLFKEMEVPLMDVEGKAVEVENAGVDVYPDLRLVVAQLPLL